MAAWAVDFANLLAKTCTIWLGKCCIIALWAHVAMRCPLDTWLQLDGKRSIIRRNRVVYRKDDKCRQCFVMLVSWLHTKLCSMFATEVPSPMKCRLLVPPPSPPVRALNLQSCLSIQQMAWDSQCSLSPELRRNHALAALTCTSVADAQASRVVAGPQSLPLGHNHT